MTTPPKPTRWWGYSCLCASSAWSGWLGCPGSSASSTKWKRWVWTPADLKALGPRRPLLIPQIRCDGLTFHRKDTTPEQSWYLAVKSDLLQVLATDWKIEFIHFTQIYEIILFIPCGTRSCGNYLIQVQASVTAVICSTEHLRFWIHMNFSYVFSDVNKKEHLPNTGFKVLDLNIHVLS